MEYLGNLLDTPEFYEKKNKSCKIYTNLIRYVYTEATNRVNTTHQIFCRNKLQIALCGILWILLHTAHKSECNTGNNSLQFRLSRKTLFNVINIYVGCSKSSASYVLPCKIEQILEQIQHNVPFD